MRLPFQLLPLVLAAISPLVGADSRIRNPIGALSTVQNATIHTHNHRLTALSTFALTFNIRDELHVRLQLEPNHEILPDGAVVSYLGDDGQVARQEAIDRLAHKVYKGTAWISRPNAGEEDWERAGWARVLVKDDGKMPFFEGAFTVHHDSHHVVSSGNYVRTKHWLDPEIEELDDGGREYMLVWRDSDIIKGVSLLQEHLRRGTLDDVQSCRADALAFNSRPDHPVYQGIMKGSSKSYGAMSFSHLFGKRQTDTVTGGNSAGVNLKSTIGDSSGCPPTSKVALVGVATDCNYAQAFNSTQSMRENVINQMNTASALWDGAFKISLGLANLAVQPASCPGTVASATAWNQPCTDSIDIDGRLNDFSEWRGTQQDNYSHWTLLSTCNTGSAVGLAWLGQACVNTAFTSNDTLTGNGATGAQSVAGANVVIRTPGANEWQIIAHETGHTYGAVHDCMDQTCAEPNVVNSQQCCPKSQTTCSDDEQHIMSPVASLGISQFSPCTVGNICSAIGRKSVDTSCLSDNKNVETITGQQCGNGIVEPGEECDCGGTEGCGNDTCCDPTTCKFTTGSVCDDANEECCSGCQFKSSGSVCRPSTGVCDPQEVCPGNNGNCPPDVTKPNGQSCGDGLQCASGICTSRDEQCKTVMGSYTQGNDTHACDSEGCTISCASPAFGYGVCYGLQQNFLDGTACGGGGTCSNGQCKGSTFGGEIRSWIDDHRDLVIGLAAGIGGLLLLCFLCCVRSCFRRLRVRKMSPPAPPPGGWQGWNSRGGYPQMQAVPPPPEQGWFASRGPPMMSGARGGWDTPPPPPQAYGGGRGARYA